MKHGNIQNGKQNPKGQTYGRQFVEAPQNKIISDDTKRLIDKLLLEKLSLAEIVRVAKVSEPWLQHYVNQKYTQVERQVKGAPKKALNAGV